MTSYSQFVSYDTDGNVTVDAAGAAAAASAQGESWLESQAQSGAPDAADVWKQATTDIAAVGSAVVFGTSLAAGASVAAGLTAAAVAMGPFAALAAADFAAAYGIAYALSGGKAAEGGSGGFYDSQGNWHQAPANAPGGAAWLKWAKSQGVTVAALGYSPSYYDVPNPAASHENGAPTVGNGPKPNFPKGSFEAFADSLLVADYAHYVTVDNVVMGRSYNWGRFPAILALAVRSWNATHESSGAAKTQSVFGIAVPIPNSGGTRLVSVTAKAITSHFGNASATSIGPESSDAVSLALWLSQYTPADWRQVSPDGFPPILSGHVKAGAQVRVRVANGPLIGSVASLAGSLSVPNPLQGVGLHIGIVLPSTLNLNPKLFLPQPIVATSPKPAAPVAATPTALPPAPAPASAPLPWYDRAWAAIEALFR
jgi:hypothetical protein